jgi:hypothetical protein
MVSAFIPRPASRQQRLALPIIIGRRITAQSKGEPSMKRIVLGIAVLCLLAVMQVMGQTTSTTTSTAASKPAAKPTSNSTAKPKSNPTPKYVFEGDGTGTWRAGESDARAAKARDESSWPSPTYEEPRRAEQREERELASEGAGSTTSAGSSRVLRCMGPERQPCTEWNVRELSRQMEEKRSDHPALGDITAMRLESSDGAFLCQQANGEHCTSEQIRSLNEHVAEPLRCTIYWGNESSSPANAVATAQYRSRTSAGTASNGKSNASLTATDTSSAPAGTSTTANKTAATPNHRVTAQNHTSAVSEHPATVHDHAPVTVYHRPPPKQP